MVGIEGLAVITIGADTAQMPEQLAHRDRPGLAGELGHILLDRRIEIEPARSTNCMAAVAVTGLAIDAVRNTVEVLTGTKFSRSARP